MDNHTAVSIQKIYLYIGCFTIAICSVLFTKMVFAEQYQLKLIDDLSQLQDVRTEEKWLDPLPSPIDGGRFIIAQNNGLIYLAGKDGSPNQIPILNFQLSAKDPAFIALTAMGLHPSFTTSEESGYATFYTAHTTRFNLEKFQNRLTPQDANINFAFETVISAWKYDFDKQKIDPQSQREILRIPIKTSGNAIVQLAFDPYQKPWNDDFGLLYVSLSNINELKDHPLYSGVILRIHPMMFGARNYTVPQTNPFLKRPEINDEIVVMGGQNIERFFWAKNSHKAIFIQHNDNLKHWISKAKLGSNLYKQSQESILRQQAYKMPSMLYYQGRTFKNLRNKMLFLTLKDKQWHLTSHAINSLTSESPVFEGVLATQRISPMAHLNIYQNKQNEIIVFDSYQSRLYSLISTKTKTVNADISQANTNHFKAKYYVLFISLLVCCLFLLFFIKRNNVSQKHAIDLLNNEYVRFEYALTQESILLYRVSDKKADKILYLKDITCCDVLLNNKVINIINSKPQNAISNQIEAEMRKLFTAEQDKKMVDGQTRQIQIVLFDKDTSYPICLYLRKGNNRVTGTKYYRVVDMLIDLCWVLSKKINSQTETRKVPAVAYSRPNLPVSARKTTVPPSSRQKKVSPSDNKSADSALTTNQVDSTTKAPKAAKTEVVEALEKLVALHKDGYLSDEEFSLAKTNLLK